MTDNKDSVNDILDQLNGEAPPQNAEPVSPAPTPEEVQPPQQPVQPKEPLINENDYRNPQQQRPAQNFAQNNSGYYGNPVSPQRDPNAPNGPQRKRKKKKHKKKRSRIPGVLILTTFIFGLSIVLSMIIIGYGKDMFGIGKSDKTQLIVIPEGASTEDIANMLEENDIIRSPDAFKLFSRLREADTQYIAGEHFLSPSMAYETIINELTTVKEEEQGESVEVTFPEGINLIEAAQLLEKNSICKADDFLFYFNSGGFDFDFENRLPTDSSVKYMRMEGYLFPDTYFFYENMDPEQVCQKIYLNFDNKMTEDRYKKMEQLGYSLDQIITLASIVQCEAPRTEDMEKVASVFWNRLRDPDTFPRLESDPTSNYATLIKNNMEVYDKTKVESYDTYKSGGLPPGAICNPGLEAIDAVLADVQTNYYYFAANINTKITYFAETLEEHEANLAMIDQQYADAEAAAAAAEAAAE